MKNILAYQQSGGGDRLNFIKERVRRMEERLLSQASKVLLNAIVQEIFTFGMRYHKLPMGLCKDIAQGDDS